MRNKTTAVEIQFIAVVFSFGFILLGCDDHEEEGEEVNTIQESTSGASEQGIGKFEASIGSKLPKEYREFLLKFNGGSPKNSVFDYRMDGSLHGSTVKRLFGIGVKGYDLGENWRIYSDRIPSGFLPIGIDSFGNLICIGLHGKNAGKLFFWNHEMGEPNEDDLESAVPFDLFPIECKGFEHWLKTMKSSHEDETALRQFSEIGTYEATIEKISQGMDPNCKDEEGFSLLTMSCFNANFGVFKALYENGARGKFLMHYAAQGGSIEIVRYLIGHGQAVDERISASDAEDHPAFIPGDTPLMRAVGQGHLKVAIELLDRGANPNNVNEEGNSVLIFAEDTGNEKELIRVLKKHGAKK